MAPVTCVNSLIGTARVPTISGNDDLITRVRSISNDSLIPKWDGDLIPASDDLLITKWDGELMLAIDIMSLSVKKVECQINSEKKGRERFPLEIGCILDHFGVDLLGKSLIDVGCRGGENTVFMMKQGAKVIGVDPDSSEFNEAISLGMPKDALYPTSLEQYQIDHPNHKFDIATVFLWTISEIDKESFAKSLSKIVKHDGEVIVTYHGHFHDQGIGSVEELLKTVFNKVEKVYFAVEFNHVALRCRHPFS